MTVADAERGAPTLPDISPFHSKHMDYICDHIIRRSTRGCSICQYFLQHHYRGKEISRTTSTLESQCQSEKMNPA